MFDALRANRVVKAAYKDLVASAATLDSAAKHEPGPVREELFAKGIEQAYRSRSYDPYVDQQYHVAGRLNQAAGLVEYEGFRDVSQALERASATSLGVRRFARVEGPSGGGPASSRQSLDDARFAARASLHELDEVMPRLAREARPDQLMIAGGATGALVGAGAAVYAVTHRPDAHR